jgi:hypothetical protein
MTPADAVNDLGESQIWMEGRAARHFPADADSVELSQACRGPNEMQGFGVVDELIPRLADCDSRMGFRVKPG